MIRPMEQSLDALIEYLDQLDARASLAELEAVLEETNVSLNDVLPYLQFSPVGYTRNLIRGGEWYNLLVLCWRNGQRSPIHDHKGSSCGMRVLQGVAAETTFDLAPNGHVWAVETRFYPTGHVLGSQDTDKHQVSNLQAGSADLVTLHIYSPPLLWMGTYSMTDATRGKEPMFLEFSEAAGI
jgi:cysteine dioxygenase